MQYGTRRSSDESPNARSPTRGVGLRSREAHETRSHRVSRQYSAAFSHDVPLPSGSFDAIVAGEFIEHVPPPYVLPSLCEFFRLLRLKGRLILATPNPHYLRNRIQGRSVLLDPSHVSQHTPSSLRRRLEDVGFSTIRTYGTGRVSQFLGPHIPVRCLYGSYLAVARKW